MKIFSEKPPLLLTKQFSFTTDCNDKEIKLALKDDVKFNDVSDTHFKIFGIPIIGRNRLDKMQQSIVLNRFNILTPKTYFRTDINSTFKTINEFDSFCELTDFIVKPLLGARGIGVKKVNRSEYKELIENPVNSINKIYSKELEDQKKHSPNIPLNYIEEEFKSGDILVQEFIEIKREFRLLCFPEEYLIYERIKKDDQLLGNLAQGSVVGIVEQTFHAELTEIIRKIRLMMIEFKYPWLSLDLYKDKDDNLGIFEFQMEFAYAGFNPKNVRDCMERSLKSYIK